MSSGLASSRCAARRFAFSSTSSLALNSALPAVWSEREPIVPVPRGTSAVSDWMSRTSSMATPSSSATIIANVYSDDPNESPPTRIAIVELEAFLGRR